MTLTKARSHRHPAVTIIDVDYTDHLALMADTIADVQTLLHSLETATGDIGLYVNAKKTEYMSYNQIGTMHTLSSDDIKSVSFFVYLGSNVASKEADVKARIGKAWGALDCLNDIWKSALPDDIKRDFFHAAVQPILIYSSQSWTLTKKLEANLDGTYSRILRAVLNISWKKHPTKQRLYSKLPPISKIIRETGTRFAGHSWRSKQELVSDTLLWSPQHGSTSLVTLLALTLTTSVMTQDAFLRIYPMQ